MATPGRKNSQYLETQKPSVSVTDSGNVNKECHLEQVNASDSIICLDDEINQPLNNTLTLVHLRSITSNFSLKLFISF
jgi:hypothetical protein